MLITPTFSNIEKPTALVTGGAGFVPSHLIDLLIKQDINVIALDNFITGSPNNIKHLDGHSNFYFVKHDISTPYQVEGKVDYIFHLASPASPIDYQKRPIETIKSGSFGTHYALDLAVEKKARFLFSSTSEVYGDPLVHPQPESYWGNVNPIGLRSCYDESKRYGEAAIMAYHRALGVDTRIIRIFNTYGPRMRLDDGRVVPAFISQALKNEPLSLFGDGSQTRSFCYVSDLVRGMWLLMQSDCIDPVNIGSSEEMTIKNFGEKISAALGIDFNPAYHPLPADDPKIRQADNRKAKQLLNWQQEVSFDDGIQETIAYFKTVI